MTLWRRQASSPAIVWLSTPARPRRSSLAISLPSTDTSGVTLPSRRSSRATSSVMKWPLVKTWK